MARGLSTARNTPGLSSRRLKEIRTAADKRQAVLLRELAAAGELHGIEVAPPTSLKRMVSGWENGAPMSADYRRLFSIVYGLTEAELGFATAHAAAEPIPSADALISDSARQASDLIERMAGTVEPLSIEQYAADLTRLAAEYMNSAPLVLQRQFVVTVVGGRGGGSGGCVPGVGVVVASSTSRSRW